MKKILLSIALLLTLAGAYARLPKALLPTVKEGAAMLREADDFIDSMPDGLQDRQADAVYHAIKGMTGELVKIRDLRNKQKISNPDIECSDLSPTTKSGIVKMRLYRPANSDSDFLPLLVYLHGGGWCFGGIESCASFCEALAATGQAMVLAVDYSLAPEKPFPSALADCCAAIEYAVSQMETLKASSVSVGGDSAGGNLALASSLWLQQEKEKSVFNQLKSIVLFYPVVDAGAEKTNSVKRYSRGYGLNSRLMEAFTDAYTANGVIAKTDWLVSPLKATTEALRDLPPVLIINAERDILFDQGESLSSRLKEAGSEVEHIVFPGAVHLFITVDGQPTAFSKAVQLTAAFISDNSE